MITGQSACGLSASKGVAVNNKGMCTQGLAVVAVIALLGLMVGCAEDQGPEDTTFMTVEDYTPRSRNAEENLESIDYSALVQANNQLAVQFFQYTNNGLEDTSNASNGVVSAYGMSQTLAMVASGARGTTAAEFPLGLDVSADPTAWSEGVYALNQGIGNALGFSFRNAVWGQEWYRFLREYLDTLSFFFEADLMAYPFKPLPEPQPEPGPILIEYPGLVGGGDYAPTGAYWTSINDWVAELSPQDVPLLPAYSVSQNDPERTRLAFTNTTNLAVDWPMVLAPADSFEGLFETFEGIQYWVPMLRQQGAFGFYQDEVLSAVELPLGNSNQSLLLITPSAGNYETVFNNLTQHLNALTGLLAPMEMEIFLPEFSFASEGKLDWFLGSLGFEEVYTDDYPGCTENCGPDFSAINGQGYLRLETMTRRTGLNFTRAALNASSITTAVLEATQNEPASVWDIPSSNPGESGLFITSCPSPTYVPEGQAHVRPFMFVVRDTQTGTILYLGQLTDTGGTEAGSWVCL